MELAFNLGESLKSSPIQRLDGNTLKWMSPQRDVGVRTAVDKMAELSAKVQGLKRSITTFEKLLNSDDDSCLYLMWERKDGGSSPSSIVYGYLKTSRRRLYLSQSDRSGECVVATPVCVMDFFIHPSVQKQGYSVVLFNNMLEAEQVDAHNLAYDKPSEALLKFLKYHYGLEEPIWQSTNFAVFPGFFESSPTKEKMKGGEAPASSTVLTSPSVSTAPTPKKGRDMAGQIIHGDLPSPMRVRPPPDTPQGRKYTRDFSHQPIW